MPPSGNDQQPFDQRYMAFILLSFCIFVFFNPWGQPPVDPPKEGGDAPPAAGDPAQPPALASTDTVEPRDDAAPGEDEPVKVEPAAAPQRVALGSLAPDGGYRMLATLSNTGAAVERIELSSPDFRDLDDRSGYLGALSVEPTTAGVGVRVTVAGPGTPASEAGIKAGDVITNITGKKLKGPDNGGWDIDSAAALETLLQDTKAGDEITVTVRRAEGDATLPVKLSRRPLALLRPEAENIRLHRRQLPADYKPAPSYRVKLAKVNGLDKDSPAFATANDALLNETWTVDAASQDEVVFRKRLPELRLEVVKRFGVPKVPAEHQDDRSHRGYHLDFEVEVVNLADQQQSVAYTIEGPNGLPIEGWWYSNKVGPAMFSRYGIRDIVVHYARNSVQHFSCSAVADDDVSPMGQGESMAYIGVDAQYFAAGLVPEKGSFADLRFRVAEAMLATPKLPEKNEITYNNPTFAATTLGVDLPASASTTDKYTLFGGPKRPKLLRAYYTADDPNYSLIGFSYYGWFGPIARIMLGILHFFYDIVGNYGVAIILLTVLVRSCMFPISRKQAQNMVMMQKLKPELDRIAAKYKDDRQKQAQAQQELFRKHNYNPLGGCLPMLLQLPIFIGLYRALAVDVELRQAPLISDSIRWCSNLAAPDMLIDWSGMWPDWFNNGQGIFALGPFFNILPIATVCLFLLQQKMFMPEPTNEQAALQQKMMKYMMGFMGLMFFKVASGLCLYFIVSSAWGVAERQLLPKPTAADTPPLAPEKPSVVKKPSPSGNGAKAAAKRKKGKKKR